MKFLKLEIKNLASLDREEGEVIDFEAGALKESTIFSIVGPTGSGKSTILDAICLALYNRAPRYPKVKGKRNQKIEIYGDPEEGEKNRIAPTDCRNILSRGKKVGYSKLTFLTNKGDIYRAEWHVAFRNKNYASDTPPQLYKITVKNGRQEEQLAVWDSIPQIIGLDYEQFLRTVLIAQGSFADFLNADVEDRYMLLEKLIGSEKLYSDIADRIKEQKDIAVDAFKTLTAGLSAFEKDIIPDEELITLRERISVLEGEAQKVKEELGSITVALQWFSDDKKILDNIGKYQAAKLLAEGEMKEAKEDIELLALHDATLQATAFYKDIKDAEGNINKLEDELKRIVEQIELKKSEIQQGGENLKVLVQNEASAAEILVGQKPHINKARTIKGEIVAANNLVKDKEKVKGDSDEACRKAKEALAKNAEDIKKWSDKLGVANQEYTDLLSKVSDEKTRLTEALAQATDLFNEENKKIEGVDAVKLQTAKSDAMQRWNDLKDAIRIQTDIGKKCQLLHDNAELRKTLTENRNNIVDLLEQLQIEALSAELDTLRATHTLMTSEDWNLHRARLNEGEPCPLCGATEHPYKSGETLAPVVGNLQKLIKDKEDNLDRQRKRKDELSQKQGEILGKLKSLDINDKTLTQEIDALQGEWLAVRQKYMEWTDNVAALEALKPAIVKSMEEASEALGNYNDTVKKINNLRASKELCEKSLKSFEDKSVEELTAAQNKINEANTYLATEKGKTANLVSQESEKTAAMQTAALEWEDARRKVEEKQTSLKNEIGDKDPDVYEQELTKAKDDAANAVNKGKEAVSELQKALEGLIGKQTITQDNVTVAKQKLDYSARSLDQWLENYNRVNERQLVKEEVAVLSSATVDWEEIRQRQSRLVAKVTETTTTYNNELKSHKEHQSKKPVQSQEELCVRKTELEQRSDQELTDAKVRVQRHDNARQQMGALFGQCQAAESLKNDWEAITQAIGTDGKTLRKIAQCYTLRFLIEHANAEIRKFNNRYELQQVKNSLGIRVIDHDRADDIRDTTSLSGGETFIVSLGLALGLSALSSRNISFENLFIDEGFGTLDPDTLTTVIDSLAMLQSSQGKKVGVISHTDTMSERITTQIRIIKNGNSGSSHIEIHP